MASMSSETSNQTAGRILVVDDQAANLRVVDALLTRHGFEVLTAETGETALAIVSEQPPHLVLLDMMMPGMDGFELLAQIRQRPELLGMPVVFLTAAQDRDLLLRAFAAGAIDYVTKPFMPEELLARVNSHVSLKLARDRLEQVARERQELVNLVAHDLKNPLTSVLFASDMLLNNGCKPARVPRYYQMIQESAQDALSYIRRYLETQSRRNAAAETIAPDTLEASSVALADIVTWLCQRYELQMEACNMHLECPESPPRAHVLACPLVLRQVTENLVSNAIKYAACGGEIVLTIRAGAPGFWQLMVEDRGPGIARDRQADLFKPFMRLVEADPTDGLSSGLGLSLARRIIDEAGGRLWYEDREGGGACFLIELPAADIAS